MSATNDDICRKNDEHFMHLALQQARSGVGRTSPNPTVGVVIVKDSQVLGAGYHRRAGAPHAEREALALAGEAARGAVMYVNLEPCCHHGRTSPCCEAIIQAGIRRVVAGITDPNPLVAGRGFARLREAGVEVTCGVSSHACARLNAPFLKHIQTGLPLVTAKYAMTLDGKIAAHTGDSRWISNPMSRLKAHQLRDTHDAVLVGTRTLLLDDPSLTTRGVEGGRDAIRVVLDRRGVIPPTARVLNQTSQAQTWIVSGPQGAEQLVSFVEPPNRIIEVALNSSGQIDLLALLEALGEREVTSVLVEGGSRLHGSFFDAALVDRVAVFIAPRIVGGAAAPSPVGGAGLERMSEALGLKDVEIEQLEGDLYISGDVLKPMNPGCETKLL